MVCIVLYMNTDTTQGLFNKATRIERRVRNLRRKMQATSANASWARYSPESLMEIKRIDGLTAKHVGYVGVACDNDDMGAARKHLEAVQELAAKASEVARTGAPLDEQPAD